MVYMLLSGGGKDKIFGFSSISYKNEYGALNVGVDTKIDNQWIVGMSVGAIEGNQKIDHYGYRAEGEDSTQSLKCYATRFDGSGSYIDFVTTINRFEQEFSTQMLDGSRAKGSYDSFAYGLSAEVGKTIGWGENNTYFWEPQLQLAYLRVGGKDFRMSNGLRVHQETADSLTGRLGFVLGKSMTQSEGNDYQLLLRGGINHEFLGQADVTVNGKHFTTNSLGTRGYYGVGFNWSLGSNMRLYGEINREKGTHYTSEINAQVSLKYCY